MTRTRAIAFFLDAVVNGEADRPQRRGDCDRRRIAAGSPAATPEAEARDASVVPAGS